MPEGPGADVRAAAERRTAVEELCRFGPDKRLFGVLSKSAQASDTAVLMLNAGSVHHIGPNRVYVNLARALAARGRHSLRFDLASIGDSVAPPGVPENHPYPPTAGRDVRAALDFLARRGYRDFILLGLCSGAHTAFHAALDFSERNIEQVILINPLTFHWEEGMNLDVSGKALAASYYQGVLRDPSRWPALLRRKIPWAKVAALAHAQAAALWKSYYGQAREWLLPAARSALSRDLQRLYDLKRPLHLVLAEGDPGLDLMLANARRTTGKGLRSGAIRLKVIGDADHTFSRAAPRTELIDYLCELLGART
jgi:pimeloyl-ACP methyl ester carboxylesterase